MKSKYFPLSNQKSSKLGVATITFKLRAFVVVVVVAKKHLSGKLRLVLLYLTNS